jgi:hypothetical protein
MTVIELQKWGFGVCLGVNDDFPGIEIIHDAFVKMRGIESVDGPHFNGTIGVTIWSNAYENVEKARTAVIEVAESLGLMVKE